MSRSCLYTVTVDTEEEWDWDSGYSTSSNSTSNISALPAFQCECDKYDAKVTYFVNHTVLANASNVEIIQELDSKPNVEIGLHIHPWNTPPLADSKTVPERESFLANLPKGEALAKLDTVFDSFDRVNIEPTSYRGGRYSTSTWIQEHLASRGVVADASIVPFTTWVDDGAPDYRDRDLVPVRKSLGIHGTIWEIPLTLAFTRRPWNFWRRFYEIGEITPFRQLRMTAIAERLFVKRVWLNLEHALGEHSISLLKKLRTSSLPCLNFTLHSSSLMAGLNPNVRSDVELGQFYERLRAVLGLLEEWHEFQPATVTEVAQNLEKQYNANSRH